MNTAKLQQSNEKTTFEKFYQGWPYFTGLNIDGDTMVFKLPNPKHAEDSFLKAQQRINDLCLPLKAERVGNRQLSNTFIVKALAICLLFLGTSFTSMAQSKPSPKTNIMVMSQGRKVTLTVSDTCYLNNATCLKNTTLSAKAAIYNYRTGGVIKNNDVADLIFTLLKNRKS